MSLDKQNGCSTQESLEGREEGGNPQANGTTPVPLKPSTGLIKAGGLGLTVWLTGLSSAGKTTIASSVCGQLDALGLRVEFLDGDVLRQSISRDLGFSREDRCENTRRIGAVAERLTRGGAVVLVAAMAPYKVAREENRRRIGNYIEVYVSAPLETCAARDLKGIYKRAREGELRNVNGMDEPYEVPESPEVLCRTDRETPHESAHRVLEAVKAWLERAAIRSFSVPCAPGDTD